MRKQSMAEQRLKLSPRMDVSQGGSILIIDDEAAASASTGEPAGV